MKWKIVLKYHNRYITRYDFGTWDELKNKYGTKIVSLKEV